MIKQMQYSPLQTEKDRVSEWGSFRYAVFAAGKYCYICQVRVNMVRCTKTRVRKRRVWEMK